MKQVTEKTIDIDELLKSKMGRKARWIPRPLVKWLKRIIHQDEVNAYLGKAAISRERNGSKNVCAILT